jgi:hypothetical protein
MTVIKFNIKKFRYVWIVQENVKIFISGDYKSCRDLLETFINNLHIMSVPSSYVKSCDIVYHDGDH